VRLGGRTLVERAVAELLPRCGRVVVASRAGVPLPPLGVPVVIDRPGPDCPMTGLATGLSVLDADDVVVLGCDLPLAGPLLDALLAAPPGAAVAAAEAGRRQPLCARYPRERALAECDRLLAAGELALTGLLDALGAQVVEDEGGAALLNVNTPKDLARAVRILGEPALS